MPFSTPKRQAFIALDWLFRGSSCSLSLIISIYMVLWYASVVLIPLTGGIDGIVAPLPDHVDAGVYWNTFLLAATLWQTFLCLRDIGSWLLRFVSAVIMSMCVVYTVLVPSLSLLVDNHILPVMGVGSFLIMFASLLVVARHFRR